MPYGNVNQTIQDGGLGAAPPSNLQSAVVVGWSSLGTNFTLTQYGSVAALVANQGYGEAVELAAFVNRQTGAPVWFLRIPSNGTAPVQGVFPAFATGTSAVTVTGTPIDGAQVVVAVQVGGTIATADSKAIQVSLDNGRTFGPTIALGAATTYKIPTINGIDPVGWTLNFAAGTLVTGESIEANLSGPKWAVADVETALTQLTNAPNSVGFGMVFVPGTPYTASALADESAAVGIDASMQSMAAGFRYARLIGESQGWFPNTLAVSTVTFASGAFTLTTTTPHGLVTGQVMTVAGLLGITGGNITATITRTSASTFTYPGTGSGSYTSGGTVSQTEVGWISQLQADWAAFQSLRTAWCAGAVNVTSAVGGPAPVGGRQARRSCLFPMAQRAVANQPSRDLAAVADNALVGCSFPSPSSGDTNVYHDERILPGLDAANFSTLWTYPDLSGIYVKNCRLFSPPGSDYTYWQYGRVMDAFCIATRAFFLKALSSNVRLNPSTGFILAQDATQLQLDAQTYTATAVVNPGWATATQIVVSTTDPLSTTKQLTVTAKCVPLGYIKDIEVTLSFAAQVFTGGISPTSGST